MTAVLETDFVRHANPFRRAGRWYKVNLHAHTTTSDGTISLADCIGGYRKAGYSALAITDHERTNDVRGMSTKDMLVISGMEYHPPCPGRPAGYHLVALNVPHGFALADGAPGDAIARIAAVKKAGGETILGHPYWCGLRYEQMACLSDVIALEIFNTQADRMARGESSEAWSQLHDAGWFLNAVAVDDTHDPEDMFCGWTMLKMRRLSVASVIDAVRTGSGYSSNGPEIHDFTVRRGAVELRCSPAAAVYLVSQSGKGARILPLPGKTLRSIDFPIPKTWRYVRAVVVDPRGMKAWTNPLSLM